MTSFSNLAEEALICGSLTFPGGWDKLARALQACDAERVAALAAVDRADAAETALSEARTALERIDKFLTTVEGDNVPRGEAVKMQVRFIARAALAGSPGTKVECPLCGQTGREELLAATCDDPSSCPMSPEGEDTPA